jgi:hypothetical protein
MSGLIAKRESLRQYLARVRGETPVPSANSTLAPPWSAADSCRTSALVARAACAGTVDASSGVAAAASAAPVAAATVSKRPDEFSRLFGVFCPDARFVAERPSAADVTRRRDRIVDRSSGSDSDGDGDGHGHRSAGGDVDAWLLGARPPAALGSPASELATPRIAAPQTLVGATRQQAVGGGVVAPAASPALSEDAALRDPVAPLGNGGDDAAAPRVRFDPYRHFADVDALLAVPPVARERDGANRARRVDGLLGPERDAASVFASGPSDARRAVRGLAIEPDFEALLAVAPAGSAAALRSAAVATAGGLSAGHDSGARGALRDRRDARGSGSIVDARGALSRLLGGGDAADDREARTASSTAAAARARIAEMLADAARAADGDVSDNADALCIDDLIAPRDDSAAQPAQLAAQQQAWRASLCGGGFGAFAEIDSLLQPRERATAGGTAATERGALEAATADTSGAEARGRRVADALRAMDDVDAHLAEEADAGRRLHGSAGSNGGGLAGGAAASGASGRATADLAAREDAHVVALLRAMEHQPPHHRASAETIGAGIVAHLAARSVAQRRAVFAPSTSAMPKPGAAAGAAAGVADAPWRPLLRYEVVGAAPLVPSALSRDVAAAASASAAAHAGAPLLLVCRQVRWTEAALARLATLAPPTHGLLLAPAHLVDPALLLALATGGSQAQPLVLYGDAPAAVVRDPRDSRCALFVADLRLFASPHPADDRRAAAMDAAASDEAARRGDASKRPSGGFRYPSTVDEPPALSPPREPAPPMSLAVTQHVGLASGCATAMPTQQAEAPTTGGDVAGDGPGHDWIVNPQALQLLSFTWTAQRARVQPQ